MKKILALAMAALSVLSLSVTAFAADYDTPGYTETDIDVSVGVGYTGTQDEVLYGDTAEEIENEVKTISGKESKPVIYVEVEWDEMKFIYDFGTVIEYKWDLDELEYIPVYSYEKNNEPGWDKTSADITFTNFSNRDVYTGVSFEKNPETELYNNVDVTFDRQEVLMMSDVGRGRENIDVQTITMFVDGTPDKDMRDESYIPALGALKFYISEETRVDAAPTEQPEDPEEPDGEHVCHFVYDQFGRLVCTGCNKVKHEYCIDEDEDGLCDECGLERDFCPDCHIGGTCRCI